ncbi:MAG: DUF502 domain-containing protein [Siphonobacter sp.]
MKNKFISQIISYFVRGLILLAPVYFTGYILYESFLFIDGLIPVAIQSGHEYIRLWGVGLILILGIILIIGFIGSTFLVIPVFKVFEELISRLPLVRIIYSSLKDLTSAFVGDKKKFNQPVLVKMDSHQDLFRLGFMTQADLSDWELPNSVAVYLPQSYAFAGHLFIVPKENVKLLDANAAEVMKFVVSGGVTKH